MFVYAELRHRWQPILKLWSPVIKFQFPCGPVHCNFGACNVLYQHVGPQWIFEDAYTWVRKRWLPVHLPKRNVKLGAHTYSGHLTNNCGDQASLPPAYDNHKCYCSQKSWWICYRNMREDLRHTRCNRAMVLMVERHTSFDLTSSHDLRHNFTLTSYLMKLEVNKIKFYKIKYHKIKLQGSASPLFWIKPSGVSYNKILKWILAPSWINIIFRDFLILDVSP